MLAGFNTNFRHRGVLFHVQTEDSGLANPHVMTHLFQGGNIMVSEKRDYAALLGDREGEELEAAVRKLMEGLHKTMLKQLSAGLHDVEIETRLGSQVFRAEANSPAAQADVLAQGPASVSGGPSPGVMSVGVGGEAPDAPTDARLASVFGERVISQRPLDEVVLDYLVENARKRRRGTK